MEREPRIEPFAIGEDERKELEQTSASTSLPPRDVLRARLILLLAQGCSYSDIQRRLHTSAPTIARWKKRFLEQGLSGLVEREPGDRKTLAISHELCERVIAATRLKPDNGSAHWSCRTLARKLGIGKDVVHRIWRREGFRPHRLERYMVVENQDRGHLDIAALYLSPSRHIAVFCVPQDGVVTGIPALCEALSVQSQAGCRDATANDGGWLSFLDRALASVQTSRSINVSIDRISREETVRTELLLERYPHSVLCLAEPYTAWLEELEESCAMGDGEIGSDRMAGRLIRHIRLRVKGREPFQWMRQAGPSA